MDRLDKLKEMLRATPSDPFLRHAMALEYIKMGDDVQARKLFEDLLGEDPTYVGSYYHLAKLLERIGDRASALHWYRLGMEHAREAGDQHSFLELEAAFEELSDSQTLGF